MITTSKGFKKPQDNDNADLRVFVGDNMDLLETELDKLALKTHNHNFMSVADTRDDDVAPTDFYRELRLDFKRKTVMGTGVDGYGGLMTLAPWGDGSGGNGTQLFMDEEGIKRRTANLDALAWGDWYTVWDSSNLNPSDFLPSTGGDLSGDITIRKTNAGLDLINSTADEWFKLYHTANAFYIQSRLADGTWKANPFSIDFATNKTAINNGLYTNGGATFDGGVLINNTGKTIAGSNLANGWLKVGEHLAMDDNEIYYDTVGYIGTIGAHNFVVKVNGHESKFLTDGSFEAKAHLKANDRLYTNLVHGTNFFANGTGDGADRTTHNIKFRGHWGMGMATYDDTIHGVYDFRLGKWDVDEGYDIGGITKLRSQAEGNLVVYSKHGYVSIAPQNTGYCHYSTDRSNHWFNKEVRVSGEIYSGSGYAHQVWNKENMHNADGIAPQQNMLATTLNTGWYTIGHVASGRASAKFVIADKRSGMHQSVHFYASHHYGNGEHITVLNNGQYSGGGAFRYLRIMGKSTYDGAYLQVYIDTDSTPVDGAILENVQTEGWDAVNWTRQDTIDGYTEQCKVDLDLGGQNATTIHTTGTIMGKYVGGAKFGTIDSTGFDCYMNVSDGNPSWHGTGYGGEFTFYGDKASASAFVKTGGLRAEKDIMAEGDFIIKSDEGTYFRLKKDAEGLYLQEV